VQRMYAPPVNGLVSAKYHFIQPVYGLPSF
jgi:hypothetical protein